MRNPLKSFYEAGKFDIFFPINKKPILVLSAAIVLMSIPGILMWQEPEKKEIGQKNIQLLFSKELCPGSSYYKPEKNEGIYDISRKFNMSSELLIKINDLKAGEDLPERLKIIQSDFSIIIGRGENKLTLYRDGKFFKEYKVASGKEFSTPTGEYTIASKLIKPPWIWKGEVIPPESPDYPLGTRWMGLSATRIGIHGTKNPEYIGEYASSGCIRMFNSDIEELFTIVPFGTKVTINE